MGTKTCPKVQLSEARELPPIKVVENQLKVVEQDPTDPDFVANPYEFYKHVRAFGDFVYWKDYDLPVAVTRHAVEQTLKHPKLGRAVPDELRASAPERLTAFFDLEEHSLLELEPPDHTRLRRLAMEGLGHNQLALIAPTISQFADELIDAFPDEPFDLLAAYAQPLTARSITRFLGIGGIHAQQLHAWSGAMVAMYQARRDSVVEDTAAKAAREMTEFVGDFVRIKRKKPSEDFLSQLIAAEDAGRINRSELISTAVLLLNAGQEATAHAIGNAVKTLAGYSERTLALQPENISGTVEECLRISPPLHLFRRYVYEPVSILGLEFPKSAQIGCLLGSSCRDDAVWPDGDKFDPFRVRCTHQAFGVGLHACAGASLARLEIQIALPALFSRCPDLKIATPPKVANLYHFHGLEKLEITI